MENRRQKAIALHASGMSYRAIGEALGVSRQTAWNLVNDKSVKPPDGLSGRRKSLRERVQKLEHELSEARARVAELEAMLEWGVDLEPIERRLACLEDLTNGRCG